MTASASLPTGYATGAALSDPNAQPERLPINGVPEGLVARPLTRADGTVQRTRRGHVKATATILVAGEAHLAHSGTDTPPNGISAREWRFALGASRRS